MGLERVIYVSTANHAIDASALADILDASVRNNGASGLTGMLLYAGGSFMQVLEGDSEAVDATLARVCRDPRHSDVFEIDRSPIEERAFANWRMGLRRLDASDVVTHPGYAPFFQHGFDPAGLGAKPGVALDLLQEFARSNT
jgi:hypothetical protein